MICGFCDQWNPEGAQRCCFCNNAPDAQSDATETGGQRYGATLPPGSAAADAPGTAPPSQTATSDERGKPAGVAAGAPQRTPARGIQSKSARRYPAPTGMTLGALAIAVLVGGLLLLLLLVRRCAGA